MSISNSYPQQRATLNLDFANSGKLDSRLSYSRSSGGTYLSNEKALSSENLLLQSQDFDTSWTASGISAPTGSQTSPAGDSTAWLLTATTFTAGSARVQQSIPISTNTEYTMVAHVKAGTASHAFISFRGASTQSCSVTLNFSTQALTNTAFNFTNVSSSVTALGNSWFKLTLTGTTDNSTANSIARVGISDGSAVAAAGNPSWNASGETMYAWGVQLSSTNSKVYDSPTTTQISRSYSPLLKTASADTPRFEFASDGQSDAGSPRGLLIEAQSSNLMTYSEDFSNAAWTKTNVTATAEAISPDGTLNAFAIRENDGGGTKRIHQAATVAAGSVAVSVYAKILGNERRLVIREDSITGDSAVFDLSSGTVAATNVGGSGTIESVGNGWYRCTLITSPGSGSKSFGFWLATATGTNYENYTGDGYSGVILFGAMCENASASSSYLESLGSTTTRAADSCSVATSSFGYTGGPVSVYTDADAGAGYYPCIFALNKGDSATDSIRVFRNFYNATTSTPLRLHLKDANATIAELIPTGSQSVSKVAIRVEANNTAIKPSGVTQLTDTTCTTPVIDTLEIGGGPSVGQLNGHIKRLSLFNVALSDTELQAITS